MEFNLNTSHVGWHPKAWERHLALHVESPSSCSSSAHDWRLYLLYSGSVVALNSHTAEEFAVKADADDYYKAAMDRRGAFEALCC